MHVTSQPAGVVLLNPEADGGHALALRRPIEAWLARNTPGVSVLVPGSPDEAQAMLAILAARSRVALVGGDGTLHHMLPAILRRGHRVGLVPAGHNNDTARSLGLDALDWPEALAYALYAPTAPVDLGQLDTEGETRHFASSLNAGFDALIAARVQAAPSWLHGSPRHFWAGAREWLNLRPHELRVWINGRLAHDGHALMVSVLNGPTCHGGIPAAPGARLDDHRFETLVVGRVGRLRGLPLLRRIARAQHLRPPLVCLHGTRKMLVDAAAPLPLSVDGEALAPVARFSVHVLPRMLQLAGAQLLAEPDRDSDWPAETCPAEEDEPVTQPAHS